MNHAQKKHRILILGGSGMLGQALRSLFQEQGEILAPPSSQADISQLRQVRQLVADFRPLWILNAAAYTRVDEAEKEADQAYRVNALGARNLALAAQEWGAVLVHYSTDYVFDGLAREPYREWDPPQPANRYGHSKLVGETWVRQLCPNHLILRTSWLFGPGGRHFVGTVAELARRRERLRVVHDQTGCPTYSRDLAFMTLHLLRQGARGLYHVTNAGQCSWFELAVETVRRLGLKTPVEPIPTAEYPTPARRPPYSVLDNYLLQLEGIPLLRPWQEALGVFLKEESP